MPRTRRPHRLRVELGRRLRAARLSAGGGRGLGQAEVAAALGISQATVSDYERGRRQPPLGTLVGLAEVLGVPVGWLITGSDALPQAACGARRRGAADGPAADESGANLSTAQARVLQESLADFLDLELVIYLGRAGAPEPPIEKSTQLRAAEDRLPYAVPAPAAEGGRFALAKRLTGGATSAVLYVGRATGPAVPGDLLLIAPDARDPHRWRLADAGGNPQNGQHRYRLLPPGNAPLPDDLHVYGAVVGLLRRAD